MQKQPNLCESCAHVRRVTSARGSVFLLCDRSRTDPRFPRYPRLPVVSCRGYDRRDPEGPQARSGAQPDL